MKVICENGSKFVAGNLTSPVHTLTLRNSAGKSGVAKLVINARVETLV
ncbi:MAG: hypothetical protein PHX49_02965 [Bacteroidales bacterium]|nr:hypothetical protein [Bacteroidales bacterium]